MALNREEALKFIIQNAIFHGRKFKPNRDGLVINQSVRAIKKVFDDPETYSPKEEQ